jgi:UDP:flavonoid glycosyltransferase YjiC (YdhE family)
MQDASNFIKGFASHKTLICQSPLFRHVLSPGVDPERYIYTGACIIDAEHQRKYNDNFGGDDGQKQIELFLDQDKNMKPVYIGFGSMLGNTPECMVVMAVKALMHANERGIILGGYAGLSLELLCKATDDEDVIVYAKKNILFVKAASHEWLFPLVKCIVHHGGAGTTQAALRSGVPTIITPVFLDQFCHSHVVNELGVGKGFKYGMKRLTYNELGSAIKAVQNEETCRRCKEVSMTIRQENGNESAAKAIQKILDESPQSSSSRPSLLESQRNQPYIAPELFVAALKAITVACVIKALVHQ